MMRNIFVTLVSLAVIPLAAPSASADHHVNPSNVSLGVGFGDPTAVDLKIWTGEGSGFDMGVGLQRWSERLGVYAEYELGLIDFWIGDDVHGLFYIGLGGAVAFRHHNDDTSLALVIPIGLNFRFHAPVELFLEARPGVELLDRTGFGIGGQLGVRYVF
ncbi:MAG: hypothetical protein U1F43_29160 [Myxococcota bacterium]